MCVCVWGVWDNNGIRLNKYIYIYHLRVQLLRSIECFAVVAVRTQLRAPLLMSRANLSLQIEGHRRRQLVSACSFALMWVAQLEFDWLDGVDV